MHVVTAYYIGPEAGRKQSTYGSLGLAAALLLGLYIIGRLIVGAAVLNATLTRAAPARTAGAVRPQVADARRSTTRDSVVPAPSCRFSVRVRSSSAATSGHSTRTA